MIDQQQLERRISQFQQSLKLMQSVRELLKGDCFIIFDEHADYAVEEDLEQGDESPPRFLQFMFCEESFLIDIPNTTLLPAEAVRLRKRRPDFFFGDEWPEEQTAEVDLIGNLISSDGNDCTVEEEDDQVASRGRAGMPALPLLAT